MQASPANGTVTNLSELLPKLLASHDLSRPQAAQLVSAMLAYETPDAQIAAALALLVAKGECADELAGFADALYQRVLPIEIPSELLDTAGTGASAVKTFNVSTAASLVIAAAGCAIAKHGARASTSQQRQCRRADSPGCPHRLRTPNRRPLFARVGNLFSLRPAVSSRTGPGRAYTSCAGNPHHIKSGGSHGQSSPCAVPFVGRGRPGAHAGRGRRSQPDRSCTRLGTTRYRWPR